MVNCTFFLRFKPQLQRISPDCILRLEEMVVQAIEEAGGKISSSRYVLQGVFEEDSCAFWLDMLVFIERISMIMSKTAVELYGYSLLLGEFEENRPLFRFLSGGFAGGGVFLGKTAADALQSYLILDKQGEWAGQLAHYSVDSLAKVKDAKIFIPAAKSRVSLLETGTILYEPEQRESILVYGQLDGKKDDLYRRFAGFFALNPEGSFPPLFVRFDSDGLNALTDAFAQWMHTCGFSPTDEIIICWEMLFRERLRKEPSSLAIRTGQRFFTLLLDAYAALADRAGVRPVVVLENIHDAHTSIVPIVIESLTQWSNFQLLGTCTAELTVTEFQQWKPLFSKLLKAGKTETVLLHLPEIPRDLWEIGYMCSLLGRYFPPDMIPALLEEAGKSPAMVSRTISLLHTQRIIDTPLDMRPWHEDFFRHAEVVLGEKIPEFKGLVRSLLLAWVRRKKINPCIRLLEALAELGSTDDIHNRLILQCLYGELSYTDRTALEEALNGMILEIIAGGDRAIVLRYITATLLAIHSGNADTIRTAFAQPSPDSSAYPLLKAQVLLNQSLFYLSQRDNHSVLETIKEAILLCQGESSPCLAHCYRVFALASLSQKRTHETIDYLGFALEDAGKNGNTYDIGIAAYYAASIQLLYGNVSRARILAEKACRHFLKAGSPEWADRCRFLEGRVAFEIGHYRQAIDMFENILANPFGDHGTEKNKVLSAWVFRAKVFGGHSFDTKPQYSGHDGELFGLEALYISGDFSGAAEASNVQLPDVVYTEQPDWYSGFAQCEHLYFPQAALLERMTGAYQSLINSRLYPSNDESVRSMQRILRSGQFPEIDPCDVFFHYAWYRVLEETAASRVDISTAVSVAFRRMQGRASRIDDPEIRRQYLSLSRWNKALTEAAKEFKLV